MWQFYQYYQRCTLMSRRRVTLIGSRTAWIAADRIMTRFCCALLVGGGVLDYSAVEMALSHSVCPPFFSYRRRRTPCNRLLYTSCSTLDLPHPSTLLCWSWGRLRLYSICVGRLPHENRYAGAMSWLWGLKYYWSIYLTFSDGSAWQGVNTIRLCSFIGPYTWVAGGDYCHKPCIWGKVTRWLMLLSGWDDFVCASFWYSEFLDITGFEMGAHTDIWHSQHLTVGFHEMEIRYFIPSIREKPCLVVQRQRVGIDSKAINVGGLWKLV